MTTDAALNRQIVLDDRAFITGSGAGASATYSHVQLWNPAGSGVQLFVTSVSVQLSDLDSNFTMARGDAPLDTESANWTASKLNLDNIAVAELRVETNAAVLGDSIASSFGQVGVPQLFNFCDFPVVINPGYGLIFRPAVVNNGIRAIFQWLEQPA